MVGLFNGVLKILLGGFEPERNIGSVGGKESEFAGIGEPADDPGPMQELLTAITDVQVPQARHRTAIA